ncbi:MAG: choice-of-anchor I family protein [Gallicola sp.]|nr:choice-of-anchor I family protein [Gallicola sp.]
MTNHFKKIFTFLLLLSMSLTLLAPVSEAVTVSDPPILSKIGGYTVGDADGDGAVAEIVSYNPRNNSIYVTSGTQQQIHIIQLDQLTSGKNTDLTNAKAIDMQKIAREYLNVEEIDITSVAVGGDNTIGISAQSMEYDKPGYLILLNDQGEYQSHVLVGVQPDAVVFSSDGKIAITSNEGEPRKGYGENITDPKGSISVYNTETKKVDTYDFTSFDEDRDALAAKKIIIKKGSLPSEDFEPEYSAIRSDNKTVYVALQENNAIAEFDLVNRTWKAVNSLGFKDHSKIGNELDLNRNEKIEILPENVMGIPMPDGITTLTANGEVYILTANEGDARDYSDDIPEEHQFVNEEDRDLTLKNGELAKEVTVHLTEGYDDTTFEKDATYVFGGRSFSIYKASDLSLVFDSGSAFEKITGQAIPDFFNVTNSNIKMDARSQAKGPEPENIVVGQIKGRQYAFIGLERIGGVMMYDVTDPAKATFVDYINTRDFSKKIAGDSSPEGLTFVSADNSTTKKPLIIAANEVSGTISVYEINENILPEKPKPSKPSNPSNPSSIKTDRFSGDTRYDTAIDISSKNYSSSKTVVLVSGENFPDALSAGVLAAAKNSPILLAKTNSIDEKTVREIKRLKAENIIIIGGDAAISSQLEGFLKSTFQNVSRIGGKDRYETSLKIAEEMAALPSFSKEAMIASGENHPDAMSIGGYAASKNSPVLLVREKSIPESTRDFLAKNKIIKTVIAGGEAAVSKTVENQLPSPLRIGGRDRYETSVKIADMAFPNAEKAFLASGEVYVDALSIVPVSAKTKTPVLLTRKSSLPKVVGDYIQSKDIKQIIYIGGLNAVENVIKD